MKPKVAFICVHNSCRSQMAEAISKLLSSDTFDAYSAGTNKKDTINEDAVNVIKSQFNYDMTKEQSPKILNEIPNVDIVITMGCNVDCPYLPNMHREDWGLDDPTGKGEAVFIDTVNIIREKVLDLEKRINNGFIKWK